MTEYTLTLVDVRRIQSYLFNANELKQILGASALVEMATHDWIVDTLPSHRNVHKKNNDYVFDESRTIENGLDAEVLFLGGGNAAILFASREKAIGFAKAYTKTVLLNAPGLDVVVAHETVNWSDPQGLSKAWEKFHKETMPKRKEGRLTSQPLLGLGVTAECTFTGLPAIDEIVEDEQSHLLSAQALAKREHTGFANQRVEKITRHREYTQDFNDFGEKGRSSYIAIVHADGNSMGKRIQAYCNQAKDNRDLIQRMRAFSSAINTAGENAIQQVVRWLENAVEGDAIPDRHQVEDERTGESRPYSEVNLHPEIFPLRPIVFGGDDVTLVCDGRLGLAVARKYIELLAQAKMPDELSISACAGVAIVPNKYPFSRAYNLAEELTKEAKHKAKEANADGRVSMLHWYVTSTGLTSEWAEIKTREYADGKLLLRPLAIANETEKLHTWATFSNQIEHFRNPEKWKWGGNKRKELREILRKGKDETRKFTELHGNLPNLSIEGTEEAHETGWYAEQCVYFDALEIDDWFVYPKDTEAA